MTDQEELQSLLRAAEPLIDLAIAEDIGPGDATSESTLDPKVWLQGRIISKAVGVVAGLPVAEAVFRKVEPSVQFRSHVADGQEVIPGDLVATVSGPGPALLAAERTVLNFLQRLSGIASLTSRYVEAVALSAATILDTRKTIPGYRVLDKYAVRMGGGQNHRMSLYDMMLIKDNHVESAGGIVAAVTAARAMHPHLPVEVEVRDMAELHQALSISPPLDRILLDNMSLAEMRQAVDVVGGRVPLEASGNVTLERVPAIAATGVDYMSVGALTHSVRALDLSMEVGAPDKFEAPLDLPARVARLKSALAAQTMILGHHYQRDDVLAFADARGDSLKLARDAVQTEKRFIIFCGVHFMAETSAILARPGQRVLIPDPAAGCYLADTATPGEVQAAWAYLDEVTGDAEAEFTPITYVNSSAALKAFCGQRGGIVCTSGNAEAVVRWALQRRPRVFFFPDQHLGRNTCRRMGIPLEDMLLWSNRHLPDADTVRQSRVILWPGACNVHQRFRPEHVQAARERFPSIRVLVHPECRMEVVDLADDVGSTAHIIRAVENSPPGTQWAIGTESRLVQRLQQEHPDLRIVSLAQVPPFCRTMSMITLPKLAEVLEALAGDRIINEVTVDTDTAHWARAALERMLEIG